MSLKRVLEPEVMDTAEEANDYNSMDHSAVNELFVADLLQFADSKNKAISRVLDLGTGTGLIPIELCKAHDSCTVLAIDMAQHMLDLAQQNVDQQGMTGRIELQKVDAKELPYEGAEFPAVMTNSIIHHIPEPQFCINELVRVTEIDGLIFVRDLMRPESDEQVKHLVETYAGDENTHSQQMFDDSLRAALSLEEIRRMVSACGFDTESVQATSDRHWTWAAIKS